MPTPPQPLAPLPRRDPDHIEEQAPLATAQWLSSEIVLKAIKAGANENMPSPVVLGQLWDGTHNRLFVSDDDRHLVTIAGSRAGKGRGLILPNLLSYPGSVVCIDPKGENAAVTARYRRDTMGQQVVILDPFSVLADRADLAACRGVFNPFEWIKWDSPEAIDEVAALADAIVVRDNERDPHWNETARSFLKGVMLYVMSVMTRYEKTGGEITAVNWTLPFVRRLASIGLTTSDELGQASSIDGLLARMKVSAGFDGAVAAAGHLLDQMGDTERGGVLSTLRRHTEFLESPAIAASLESSDFDPTKIGSNPTTIYLVLPEWRMGTHSRWLRTVIISLMQAFQRSKRQPGSAATLFILDEFATLGYMEAIERAAAYIAGFGVKLWMILQDLNQLKSLYKTRWETFLGNAGALTAFGNTDVTTLEYLSKRLGETEITRILQSTTYQQGQGETRAGMGHIMDALSRGRVGAALLGHDSQSNQSGQSTAAQPSLQRTALITPDEIARHFAREEEAVLVHLAGQQPFRLNRIRYDLDEPFRSRAAPSPYH